MKAITLHQPWASLIALGAKTIETRSWKPPAALIGQRLLIHAAAKRPSYPSAFLPVGDYRVIYDDVTFPEEPYSLTTTRMHAIPVGLPLGAIVASCVLADAVPMVDRWEDGDPESLKIRHDNSTLWIVGKNGAHPAHAIEVTSQRPYGDFAPGRWAWLLEDVKPTTERCPACWGENLPCLTPWCSRVLGHDDEHGHWSFDACALLDLPLAAGICPTCHGHGGCDPTPAKGKQGLWNWDPAVG